MTTLLAVSPTLALILAAALIAGLRLLRPRFNHSWLIAVAGGLLALGLLLANAPRLPLALPLARWQPEVLLPFSPALLLDGVSWPLALAVTCLNLAFLLTNVMGRAALPANARRPVVAAPDERPAGPPGTTTAIRRSVIARWRGWTRLGRSAAQRLLQKTPLPLTLPPAPAPTQPAPAASDESGSAPHPAVQPTLGRPGGAWNDLTSGLLLCAATLLGLLAGNLPTLLIVWTLLDLLETFIWLTKVRTRRESEGLVVALSVRLLGVGLATGGGAAAYAAGQPLAFDALSPQLAPSLLLAAGLRLSVLPLRPPLPQAGAIPGGLRSLLRLAPSAASLVVLARSASGPASAGQTTLLLVLAGAAVLLGGLIWNSAPTVQEGLPYWLLGGCGLALAAAARGLSTASLAWGLAALLAGGLIGLAAVRPKPVGRLSLLAGGLGFTALPFTPAWPGARLYDQLPLWLLPVFLAGHGLLLAGLARHTLRRIPAPTQAERWVWIIYPLGLALLPGAQLLSAWWPVGSGLLAQPGERPAWLASGLAGAATLLALGIFILQTRRRGKKRRPAPLAPLPGWMQRLRSASELGWLYRLAWQVYRLAGRAGTFVSAALEGQAGLLWALLTLILLLSLLVGARQGGG